MPADMIFCSRTIIWATSLLGTAAAIVASVYWLDRPIASVMHSYSFRNSHQQAVEGLSHFPNPVILLAVVLSAILGLRIALGGRLSRNQANTFVCSLAVLFTETTKDGLKFFFGRTWPETWLDNNPSFIRDGVYGFHFLHGGNGYQSFPSGHMAAACTVISVLWVHYPRFRRIYVIAGLLVGTALIAGNYHFLSDVIGGAFLGLSSGWLATVIWDRYAGGRETWFQQAEPSLNSTAPTVDRKQ